MNVHSFLIYLCAIKWNTMIKPATTFMSVISVIISFFMIYAGMMHFVDPELFTPYVPKFLKYDLAIIYISGVVEIIIGTLILFTKYRGIGSVALFILLLTFLPIHLWDVILEQPIIGSKVKAVVRLSLQFLFIALAWELKTIYFNKK